MSSPTTKTLEDRREALKEQIHQIGELRLGSLFFRYRKCGKPTCACSKPEHPGHGGWVISKAAGGKTVMSTVTSEKMLPVVREQIAEGLRFQRLCAEFAETSDELAKARLRGGVAEAKATAKKGAWGKRSRRRSSPRSRR